MSIPRFIVPQIHLDQINSSLNQLSSHQERPPERISPVAILHFGVRIVNIKSLLHTGIREK